MPVSAHCVVRGEIARAQRIVEGQNHEIDEAVRAALHAIRVDEAEPGPGERRRQGPGIDMDLPGERQPVPRPDRPDAHRIRTDQHGAGAGEKCWRDGRVRHAGEDSRRVPAGTRSVRHPRAQQYGGQPHQQQLLRVGDAGSRTATADRSSNSNRTASRRRHVQRSAFPLGRVGETGSDIVTAQLGKLLQELILGRAAGRIFEHVTDRDSRASNTRLSKPDSWANRDPFKALHQTKPTPVNSAGNPSGRSKLQAGAHSTGRDCPPLPTRAATLRSPARPPDCRALV